jgi:hypothetical protein
MMTIKEDFEAGPDGGRTDHPKPYSTPRLIFFGDVRQLTAGGSGNAAEGAPGAPRKRP